MITISREKLDKLEREGAQVRRSGGKKRVETTPTEKPASSPDYGKALLGLTEAQTIAAKQMAAVTAAVQALAKAHADRKPTAYKFTMNRDEDNFLTTIDAKPIGG